MVKVKICGITNLEDALSVIGLKPDAIGFVFYKKSPRYIKPQEAKRIIKNLPKKILKVGVFVNAQEKTIKNIAKLCCLDILQFHGDESPEFCRKFKGHKIIKALRVKNQNSLKNLKKYPVWAFLFDTYQKSRYGGTGKRFDCKILKNIKPRAEIIFLSGGLNAKNVQKAIQLITPAWVDVSSSVEIRPGKKDNKKVKNFIEAARKCR